MDKCQWSSCHYVDMSVINCSWNLVIQTCIMKGCNFVLTITFGVEMIIVATMQNAAQRPMTVLRDLFVNFYQNKMFVVSQLCTHIGVGTLIFLILVFAVKYYENRKSFSIRKIRKSVKVATPTHTKHCRYHYIS